MQDHFPGKRGDLRLTKIQELGGSLEKLLSLLKKNREMVPLEVLKSTYKQPYDALTQQINKTASAFVIAVLTDHLILNPDIPVEEQIETINQAIAESGMGKEMSACICGTYSTKQLYQQALVLRQKIENALWPYISLKSCLVYDLDRPDMEPVIYNTLTRQTYRDGIWINEEPDLWGKLLFFPNSYKDPYKK